MFVHGFHTLSEEIARSARNQLYCTVQYSIAVHHTRELVSLQGQTRGYNSFHVYVYVFCTVFLFSHKLPPSLMSRTHNTTSPSSSFHSIINNALKAYERRTKKNLLSHPLAEQLQTCASPAAILLVFKQQVQEIYRSQSGDEMLTKWLDPTVKVLYSFTEVLGEGVGLVCFTCFPLRSAHPCLW